MDTLVFPLTGSGVWKITAPRLAICAGAVDWRTVGASTLLPTELDAATRPVSPPPALYMPRARGKTVLAQSRYCGAAATGGPAKGGKSQFGSTFGLCFSGNAGISQGHGNVFASAELCRVYMTQQSGSGTIQGATSSPRPRAETGEYIMTTTNRRIALLTGASLAALGVSVLAASPALAAPHDTLVDGVIRVPTRLRTRS